MKQIVMKNLIVILISLIVVLAGLLWYLKPTETSTLTFNKSSEQQEVLQKEQSATAMTQTTESSAETVMPTSNTHLNENQLADTKSDLSIQPIDPETDPGNQIVTKN